MQHEAAAAEQSILTRLDNLRAKSNYYTKQIYVRDQLIVNVFVNHDKLDLHGKLLGEVQGPAEISSSSNPGHNISQEEEIQDEESKETSV